MDNKNNFPFRKTEEGMQSKIPKWNLHLENDLFYFGKNPNHYNHKKNTPNDSEELSCFNSFLLNIAAAIPTAMALQQYLLNENILVQFLSCVLIHHLLLTLWKFIILGKQNSKDSRFLSINYKDFHD